MKEKRTFAPIDLNIPIAVMSLAVFLFSVAVPMMNRQDDKIEKALTGIREEMRDFHDRLVRIEERRK